MRILSNSAIFSAGRPLLPAHNFSATMATPFSIIVWLLFGACLNFLAIENMPSHFFGPCLLWPSDWIDQDTTWYGGMPRPRRLCVRWGPCPPARKRAQQPPRFGLLLCPASPQARILPITRIVDYRQCAAGGYRCNPPS